MRYPELSHRPQQRPVNFQCAQHPIFSPRRIPETDKATHQHISSPDLFLLAFFDLKPHAYYPPALPYLQSQHLLDVERPFGPEVQSHGQGRLWWNDAVILRHSELIAQLLHTLQSPGHWQSRPVAQGHSAAVLSKGEGDKKAHRVEKNKGREIFGSLRFELFPILLAILQFPSDLEVQ